MRAGQAKMVARPARRLRKRLPYFARLAPHELEILACLAEECGEACQAVCKILRHGSSSRHPKKTNDNRTELGIEVGQISAVCEMAIQLGALRERDVARGRTSKWFTIAPYLHHVVIDEDEKTARPKRRRSRA